MKDEEKENIKYRLSDIGKQIGELALEYIADLEKKNKQLKEKMGRAGYRITELKMQIEKMKCKNAFYCADKNSNAIPCYNVYLCKYCSKRS